MLGGSIPGRTRTISISLYDQVQNFDYNRKRKKWLIVQSPRPEADPPSPLQAWTWDAMTNVRETLDATRGPTAGSYTEVRNALIYDDVHDIFVYLRTISQYGNMPEGYQCQGGDTETWWYRM